MTRAILHTVACKDVLYEVVAISMLHMMTPAENLRTSFVSTHSIHAVESCPLQVAKLQSVERCPILKL